MGEHVEIQTIMNWSVLSLPARSGTNNFDIVYYNHPMSPFSSRIRVLLPEEKEGGVHPNTAYLLEKIHHKLKERFPEEYEREKQALFDEMLEKKFGLLKYVGSSPL